MKVYGYCRISTSKQSMERQIRNIKLAYPDAVIVKETYTGTIIQGRKEFEKLLKIVSTDAVILEHLAQAKMKVGKFSEALEVARRAQQFAPQSDDKEVGERLEKLIRILEKKSI